MKTRSVIALVGLAISFAMPTFAQEQKAVDPEVRQQIEAAVKKHEDAYNKYDAAAYAALYTPDAIEVLSWQSESGATVGQQAIEKMAAAEFASFPAKQSFTLVQVYAIGSEICAISEFIHVYRQGSKGYAVTIYVREGDDWKIRMVYAN
jgi:ketosteroid isomerase-like protein